MKKTQTRNIFRISAGLAALVLVLAAGPSFAQSGDVPRTWDDQPDMNGIWQSMSSANWNIEDHPSGPGHPDLGAIGAIPPGQGIVVGGEIPYQAAARQQRDENFANRMSADPEAKCFMPGVPRANYMPYPFQIIQGDRKILMIYGFAEANRTIHMDQENPEPPPIDSWMGRSHGRWEDDTLVVDAEGFLGEAWFDRAGNFASSRFAGPGALHAARAERDPLRGHARGSHGFHPAVGHQPAALSPAGGERAGAGIQMHRVLGGSPVRASAQ